MCMSAEQIDPTYYDHTYLTPLYFAYTQTTSVHLTTFQIIIRVFLLLSLSPPPSITHTTPNFAGLIFKMYISSYRIV